MIFSSRTFSGKLPTQRCLVSRTMLGGVPATALAGSPSPAPSEAVSAGRRAPGRRRRRLRRWRRQRRRLLRLPPVQRPSLSPRFRLSGLAARLCRHHTPEADPRAPAAHARGRRRAGGAGGGASGTRAAATTTELALWRPDASHRRARPASRRLAAAPSPRVRARASTRPPRPGRPVPHSRRAGARGRTGAGGGGGIGGRGGGERTTRPRSGALALGPSAQARRGAGCLSRRGCWVGTARSSLRPVVFTSLAAACRPSLHPPELQGQSAAGDPPRSRCTCPRAFGTESSYAPTLNARGPEGASQPII